MTQLEVELLDFLLPAPGAAWTPAQTQAFLDQKGTRSAVYLAVGLLIRNQQSDAARAESVLELLVGLQKREPGLWLGVWPGDNGTTGRTLDHNWREFIGVGLIVARERYGKLLPKALIEKIDAALLIATEGDVQRNVTPEYTNIALMSAFLQEWVGATLSKPEIAAKGAEKARQVAALFNLFHTFTEDNSPTYGGVDAMFLALGLHCPPDALAHFKAFDKPRRLERKVSRAGKIYPVQCVLEKTWMMGATTGLTRTWEQHAPGTIHWRLPDGTTGWLLVHGTNGAEATIVGDSLQIQLPKRSGERLRLLMHAPGCALGGPTWNLNGLRVKLETALGEKSMAVVTDTHFGKVLEVSWALPVNFTAETVLTLMVVK